jgi:hypothetical protein
MMFDLIFDVMNGFWQLRDAHAERANIGARSLVLKYNEYCESKRYWPLPIMFWLNPRVIPLRNSPEAMIRKRNAQLK